MNLNQNSVATSVLAKLKNEALKTGELFNPLLSRYVGFRFLYRLSVSTHRDRFLLKGATMFLFWTGSIHRPTRDLDLLSLNDADITNLENLFKEICDVECPADGVTFAPSSVKAELIREEQTYGGTRLTVVGFIGTARIPLQVDIGLGDVVTPSPINVTIPPIISTVPEANLQGYPLESSIAEKFQAMVVLGIANSRMKDFYDVAYLANTLEVSTDTLREAILATFRRRQTPIPTETPVSLSPEFLADPLIQARWRAFVRKNNIKAPYADLAYVQEQVRGLVLPALNL